MDPGRIQRLTAVIPVAAERTNVSGGPTLVTSVEVWTSQVVVRWAILDKTPSQGDPWPEGGWRLSDDVGTSYKMNSGMAEGATPIALGHTAFLPRVPADARRLVIERPGLLERIEIALP